MCPSTSTCHLPQPPFLEITLIVIAPVLRFAVVDWRAHPVIPALCRQDALFFELFRYSLGIYVEILPHKVPDLGVFVITHKRARIFGIRGVNIDIHSAMSVSRPADLRTARNHVCEGIGGRPGGGVLDQASDLVFGIVVNA